MKKFWKKTEGFTLVELIVVISILGILAGVGTVGYSGYIAKANKAADEILLDSLNTAFAAACIENNDDINSPDVTPTATLDADGKVASITYQDAFEDYYDMSAKFKVITALKFENGQFVNADGSAYSNLVFDADAIAAVKASAFWTAEGLGVNNLMGKVDYITGLAASLAAVDENGVGNGAWNMLVKYNTAMFEDLGIEDPANLTTEDMRALQDLVNAKIAVLETQGIDGFDELTDDEKSQYAQNEILANYAVLDAAKKMQNQDASTVLSNIKSTSNFADLIKNSEDGISQAAAAYGLYTAYAYSIEDETEREAAIAAANDPVNLLKAMDDEGFRTYLDDPQAETDLEGYMAAMEMVDSSASDEDAVYSLMVNGFTDPALLAVIQQAMK